MDQRLNAGFCDTCGKKSYWTRKAAKKIAAQHRTHKSPYQCPHNELLWHVGELHNGVIHGVFTRDQVYRKVS